MSVVENLHQWLKYSSRMSHDDEKWRPALCKMSFALISLCAASFLVVFTFLYQGHLLSLSLKKKGKIKMASIWKNVEMTSIENVRSINQCLGSS